MRMATHGKNSTSVTSLSGNTSDHLVGLVVIEW